MSWELSAIDHVHPVWISQILSTLFNLTVAQLPRLAENNQSCLLMFADDKTLYASHRDPAKAGESVTKAVDLLGSTLAIEGLSVTPIHIGCKLYHKPTLSVMECPSSKTEVMLIITSISWRVY